MVGDCCYGILDENVDHYLHHYSKTQHIQKSQAYMTIQIGVVMDPIGSIKIAKDSTFAMLLEAQSREWRIQYMELNDLFLSDGKPYARMR